MQSSFIYVYQLNTPSEVVIKVGHGTSLPQARMADYCKTYGLDVIPSSLRYWTVANSEQAERQIFALLASKHYRNLKEGIRGPQELFQAPSSLTYDAVVNDIEEGVKSLNGAKAYSLSELVGAKAAPKRNVTTKPVTRQTATPISIDKVQTDTQSGRKVKPPKIPKFILDIAPNVIGALIVYVPLILLLMAIINSLSEAGITLKDLLLGVFCIWFLSKFGKKTKKRSKFF
ncbi:GIY-YIG nuclease family protein [Shewanella youngdeokensis]|uniref:GIY-YIG nuclease family protein n=1 Tax=Shewanella youngdeokensis TaxID=2999068 RepID=A0ABZ0JZ49_9GAMM|nr:GIY-YIG nuclease family protein [Shewanella sp. DAU334]